MEHFKNKTYFPFFLFFFSKCDNLVWEVLFVHFTVWREQVKDTGQTDRTSNLYVYFLIRWNVLLAASSPYFRMSNYVGGCVTRSTTFARTVYIEGPL